MAVVNDVVLIYLEDTPVSFARIESLLPDAKKDWYHIKLLMLQIPMQVVTWILKDEYINGQEFHMNGKKMKMEKVKSPEEDLPLSKPAPSSDKKAPENMDSKKKNPTNIISFLDLKKNHAPESG
ncbi:MAG: hypothetical protein KKE44_06375 [Proteobacteria bacterium]|nr:hypothetical protein [Pseudomonadota bacterium]MBU1582353.1 hypothetical protein [Pseudomonadota bacterium]MBU2453008.1 hypothetical protein [Pseudomonadota bacterium]MBU2628416.1 hypothetical protein [Pseudomonadota bacterium]